MSLTENRQNHGGLKPCMAQHSDGRSQQQPMSWMQRAWFGFSWATLGFLLAGCNRLRITGAEHVPAGGGVLLAANHRSIVDTLLIPWANLTKVKLEVVWAPAKAELFAIPLLNRLITSWGAFP